MRHLLVVTILVLAVGTMRAETPGGKKAEVKGPHICCGMCEKSVAAILDKVDGISDVVSSKQDKTVTFTAKDKAAAEKAWDALYAGGFAGTLTFDGATLGKKNKTSDTKVDEVTVEKVHACCGQCVKAINALFKGSKVTVAGNGAQRTVIVAGKDLNPEMVLQMLNETGFNGTIAAKK
jgi:copper chaperone CopZ